MARRPDGGALPALVIVADRPAALRAAGLLFPGLERLVLGRDDLRPPRPFAGPLFERLATLPAGACVALAVPVVRASPPAGEPAPLLAVADHVNLELRGPLTGPWPADVPRSFPAMSGIYQPRAVLSRGAPQVYSCGVVMAGVACAARLSAFEAGVIRERRLPAYADCLAPPVIAAAYYGLTVAACGVLWSDDNDEE